MLDINLKMINQDSDIIKVEMALSPLGEFEISLANENKEKLITLNDGMLDGLMAIKNKALELCDIINKEDSTC